MGDPGAGRLADARAVKVNRSAGSDGLVDLMKGVRIEPPRSRNPHRFAIVIAVAADVVDEGVACRRDLRWKGERNGAPHPRFAPRPEQVTQVPGDQGDQDPPYDSAE